MKDLTLTLTLTLTLVLLKLGDSEFGEFAVLDDNGAVGALIDATAQVRVRVRARARARAREQTWVKTTIFGFSP